MKGDFSRSTSRENILKHYIKVNAQQGRVQLDSDWNEQTDIHTYYQRAALHDLIGESGTLNGSTGFSIISNDSPLFFWDNVPGTESAVLLEFLKQTFGVYWIEGLQFVKSPDGRTISMSAGSHSLSITLNDAKTATLIIESRIVYEFTTRTQEGILSIHHKLYTIGAGHYYVEGILCENETQIDVLRQPDLPLLFGQNQYLFSWDNVPGNDSEKLKKFLKLNSGIETLQFAKSSDGRTITSSDGSHSLSLVLNDLKTRARLIIDSMDVYEFIAKTENDTLNIYYKFNPVLPDEAGNYLAYLDVWERHLTALDDPEIAEPALGGADTTTRTKIVWQVKLLKLGSAGNVTCLSQITSWNDLVTPSTGTLQARSRPPEDTREPCILPPQAGYRGLENQLYRVEIHDPGEPGNGATFKWSRDNGAVVAGIKNISGAELTVTDTGRDKLLGFAPGQWVEVIDNRHELWGIPGTLARLIDVKENTLTFDINSVRGDPLNNENYPEEFNPVARGWDSPGIISVTIPAESEKEGYIEIEDGIEVRFAQGSYKINDYWLIPARTAKGDIEWPVIGDSPRALSPEGVKHHFCRLALFEYDNNGFIKLISDCRKFFPSSTALNGLSASTGIISLTLRQGHDVLFGPFEHWLENLSTPPAIILGLSQDPFSEIDFELSQNFNVVNVNLKTFKIIAPSPPKRELKVALRWWAIPGQDKGVQTGQPVPSITFDPPTIRIGGSAIIRVKDPGANIDRLKIDSVEIIVSAFIGPSGESGSQIIKVNAIETGPDTGIFEVQIEITDKNHITVGGNEIVLDGTFELFGGFVETSYLYSDGKQITDIADIPKVETGSITGNVTDSATIPIEGATVFVAGTSISTVSDNNGSYTISNAPVGEQTISASKAGFGSAEAKVTVNANQKAAQDFILILLTGSITGKVTDAGTNPIQGATVSVILLDIKIPDAATDINGSYTISNVPVGTQTVEARKAGFKPEISTITVLTNQSSTVDFELSERCVAGTPNKPCPAAKVDNICPAHEFIRPCLAVIKPCLTVIRPCLTVIRPEPNLRQIKTEESTPCHAGRPTIAPKSGQRPQIKPRGNEVD